MEEWVGAGPCGRSRHAGCFVGCRGCLAGALAHPAPTDCSQGLSCQRGARSVFPSGCSQLLLLSPGSLEDRKPGLECLRHFQESEPVGSSLSEVTSDQAWSPPRLPSLVKSGVGVRGV